MGPIAEFTNYWENELFPWAKLSHPYDSSNKETLLVYGTPHLPFIAVALYLLMIVFLPKILKASGVQPIFIRKVAAMWNLFLSITSFFMLMGVGLPFAADIERRGLVASTCDADHYHFPSVPLGCVYWAFIFAMSKYAELIDTVFLILRQRPVPFLHWWHHTTVLLFTWFAEYHHMSAGYVFICVNAFVHMFMYFYYFLSEMGKRPGRSVAMMITVIQITQMFIGIGTIAYSAYWSYGLGLDCSNTSKDIMHLSGVIMYGSYLFLFMRFFINRYVLGNSTKPVKAADAKKNGQKGKKSVKAD